MYICLLTRVAQIINAKQSYLHTYLAF